MEDSSSSSIPIAYQGLGAAAEERAIKSRRAKRFADGWEHPKPKPPNPIEDAIKSWFETLPAGLLESIGATVDELISTAPKRWIVYAPMALLPSGGFSHKTWTQLQSALSSIQADDLWTKILGAITKKEGKGLLTHLAINSGIPLHKIGDEDEIDEYLGLTPEGIMSEDPNQDNILRTPSGLITLHGDFGPSLSPDVIPSERDFKEAFWVSTKQNGITQIWAPRYTMFSRGNVKEKARLLEFHSSRFTPESRKRTKQELGHDAAVDLYAGIGYFVFSYVKVGMGKVLGWELNPWSVEGLRRGAQANGWSIRIVKSHDEWEMGTEDIVVFLEDNRKALERLKRLPPGELRSVKHVNCGLLPSSEGSWETAMEILPEEGWIHVHENVGHNDVGAKKRQIQEAFSTHLQKAGRTAEVIVEHVEFVKTFAPGVWHCVFDVYIRSGVVREPGS
ncbi:hypothetical protein G7Y89_g7785 [Cudoniella acicularis]|uniref:tRNA wybutosine-synthesizing protein 2 n=1 Tax=Cudoniella acicularis TaxID=354080 RepID=A0A8H4RHU8_9HELO|nr:hypothetical protein G7Y89_g7785 [Cudoniella acicularis]